MRTSGQLQEPLSPFTIPEVVAGYEAWYETNGRRADRLEKTLLRWLIAGFPEARTILEVGCGTGHFTRWFAAQGCMAVRDEGDLEIVGLDLSPLMLFLAVLLGSPPCVRADASALPFPTGAFDLVALITTLEFLQVLVEALRVAKQGLILGVLNRSSLLGRRPKREEGPVWNAAHFFTPAELVQLIEQAATGQLVAVQWRTTLWPVWQGSLPLPWGGFIGVAVKLL